MCMRVYEGMRWCERECMSVYERASERLPGRVCQRVYEGARGFISGYERASERVCCECVWGMGGEHTPLTLGQHASRPPPLLLESLLSLFKTKGGGGCNYKGVMSRGNNDE